MKTILLKGSALATFISILCTLTLWGQTDSIPVFNQGGESLILAENLEHRFQATKLKQVLGDVADEGPTRIVMHRMGLPVSAYTFENKILTSAEFISPKELGDYKLKNYKLFQFFVEPTTRIGFGGLNAPIVIQLNLVPTARISLWRGMAFTAQLIFPVVNDLDIPEDDFVRPGIITLSQFFHLPGGLFSEVSAGYFSDYRYGVHGKLFKYLLSDQLLLRGEIGYTGYASYPQRLLLDEPEAGWQFTDINYLDYEIGVSYRVNAYDLIFDVNYRKYIYERKGIEFSVRRQFDEFDLEVFGQFEPDDLDRKNYGFALHVPLWPKKYYKNKRMVVRPARYYRMRYGGGKTFFTDYETGFELEEYLRHLHPDFLSRQLQNN